MFNECSFFLSSVFDPLFICMDGWMAFSSLPSPLLQSLLALPLFSSPSFLPFSFVFQPSSLSVFLPSSVPLPPSHRDWLVEVGGSCKGGRPSREGGGKYISSLFLLSATNNKQKHTNEKLATENM
mmetsp:Transcript_12647/g.24612  ORF Transcript_12647/g.24612 Transcript_12647/m.24612 type:complete len:125 (+) Transcript_12647:378-752(+)